MKYYVLTPSLEHMTCIKIVATLCYEGDVKDLLARFYIKSRTNFKSRWKKIEDTVVKKVSKLPVPKQMKEKMLCLIRPVGFQIAKWRQYHYIYYNLTVDLPYEFYWTPQGTIDMKKTAELIIHDESIDITTRYMLACIYCLEDDIKELWNKIPKGRRKSFYSRKDPRLVKQNELVVFWTYHIKGEVNKMDSIIEERMIHRSSPYRYAFDIAANSYNKVAIKYFLRKLTTVEREESLVKTTISATFAHFSNSTAYLKENVSDILCFLLREFNEEQQVEVFKGCGGLVLMCFLDWPLQIFFMETANRMWNYLSKLNYCQLLLDIICKIKSGHKDFNYQMLFGQFWKESPNDYKKYVFRSGFDHRIVSDLFKIRDENNIQLIFQDATPKDKRYLIYIDKTQAICKELMDSDQLNLLKYFIKECLPSKGKVIEFKEDLKNCGVWGLTEYQKRHWQQKFFCVLDDVICEFKKRKCEEGDSSKAKKVCSAEFKSVVHISEK